MSKIRSSTEGISSNFLSFKFLLTVQTVGWSHSIWTFLMFCQFKWCMVLFCKKRSIKDPYLCLWEIQLSPRKCISTETRKLPYSNLHLRCITHSQKCYRNCPCQQSWRTTWRLTCISLFLVILQGKMQDLKIQRQ